MSIEKSDLSAASWYRWHGIVSQPTYRVIEYFKRYGNPADPTVFDNCSTKVREYAYRAFGLATVVGAAAFLAKYATLRQVGLLAGGVLALEVGRLALHLLGYSAQKENYLHIRGEATEINTAEPKIMSWNILGFPAGMNYTCGGCIPFRHRFQEIAQKIRHENADIVILQECWMDASVSEAFVNEFKKDYAHFFTHNGPTKLGLESGLLVMTKCAVSDYTFTPFDNNPREVTRGFTTLTISHNERPPFAVIGTHMHAGYSLEDEQKRSEQLTQIHEHAKTLLNVERVILAGDLNMNAKTDGVKKILEKVLVGFHRIGGLETCTTELNKIRYPNNHSFLKEWIDQIAVIKRNENPEAPMTDFKIIPAYERVNEKINSKTALSDHNLLVATLNNS